MHLTLRSTIKKMKCEMSGHLKRFIIKTDSKWYYRCDRCGQLLTEDVED